MNDQIDRKALRPINKSAHYINIFAKLSLLLFFILMTSAGFSFADGFKGDSHSKGKYSEDQPYYAENDLPGGPRENKGNEATGVIAVFLLVLANLTVCLSLILKGVSRLFSSRSETKNSINDFNRAQKKYLKGLHYILNPIALCIAVVHFHLSTCRTFLPDAALILFLILAIMGAILKFQLSPKNIHKVVYSLHCSSITFLAVIVLLAFGHMMI